MSIYDDYGPLISDTDQAIVGGTIDIGGCDTSSFHVDDTGRMWLGACLFDDAPFKVTAEGVLTAIAINLGPASDSFISFRSPTAPKPEVASLKWKEISAGQFQLQLNSTTSLLLSAAGNVEVSSNNGAAIVRPQSNGTIGITAGPAGEVGMLIGYLGATNGKCWVLRGNYSGTTGATGLLTVNFPLTWSAAPMVFLQPTSGAGVTPHQINAVTTTTFTIQGPNSTAITGFWFAIQQV